MLKDVASGHQRVIPNRELLLSPPIGGVEALAARPAGPGSRMRITVTQLQRIASRMHSLDETLDERVHTRIRYLVRSGFPRRYDVAKGATTVMDLGDALKLVVAFELLSFGMSAVTVTTSLGEGWDVVGRSLGSAWLRRSEARTAEHADLLLVRGDAARGERDGQRIAFAASSLEAFELAKEDALATGSVMILDLHRLANRLEEAVIETLVATPRQLETEMRVLASEIFDSADENDWTVLVETLPA